MVLKVTKVELPVSFSIHFISSALVGDVRRSSNVPSQDLNIENWHNIPIMVTSQSTPIEKVPVNYFLFI